MAATLEARIVELELRFMHQQRTLEELSEVVVEQGREIARLQAEIETMRARSDAAEEPPPAHDPPPHY